MVKLAKEIDEPDKLRIEDESVEEDEKNTDFHKGPIEVFDGGEDTEERVKMPHSEMREKSEVASVEEGHDIERDGLDRALKSALETQVIVCADQWLSVFSDYVGRLGNEQEAKHKGIFKDIRFYPVLNFGHFWALPSLLTFHNVNNDGQSIFLGGGGNTTEKKDKREQNNIVRVFW